MRAKLALWIMGAQNRAALDDLMEVFCGTKRNYQTRPKGELIDILTRRWYSSPAGKEEGTER